LSSKEALNGGLTPGRLASANVAQRERQATSWREQKMTWTRVSLVLLMNAASVGCANLVCGEGAEVVDGVCVGTLGVAPMTCPEGAEAQDQDGDGATDACLVVEAGDEPTCGIGTHQAPDGTCVRGIPLWGDCADPPVLEDVDVDVTLLAGSCHLVRSNLRVSATLTIQPGVTVLMEDDAGLQIRGGALDAFGNFDGPIRFQSATTQTPGAWRGISFVDTTSTNNRLQYVEISHAGGPNAAGGAALHLDGSGTSMSVRVEVIRNVSLLESAGYGLYLGGPRTTLAAFVSNALKDNQRNPARVHIDNAGLLDASSTWFQTCGADVDCQLDKLQANVEVFGGTLGRDSQLGDLEVRWLVEDDLSIDDHTLTLLPGTEVEFADGVGVSVSGDGCDPQPGHGVPFGLVVERKARARLLERSA
jgi:hypothetical protein